jgi:nucleoside-diphosphate-sugar epimerase
MDLTVLGGKGFVGKHFCLNFPKGIAKINTRDDYSVRTSNVLYFISTIHNHNILNKPFLDIETNLTTLIQVLESWRLDGGAGTFNFISSWFVYGPNGHNVSEAAHCYPLGFYSITKRAAEQLLQSYCETYNLKYRILRLGNVVGPGDTKISDKRNALQYMLNRLAANQDIVVDGNGGSHRDFIHVTDCARAINLVLKKGNVNEIYNIGNGETWSIGKIVQQAKLWLLSESEIRYLCTPQTSFWLNTDKLKALGYKPLYEGEALFRSLIE